MSTLPPRTARCLGISITLVAALGCGRMNRPIDDGGPDAASLPCLRHEQCGPEEICDDRVCEPAYGRPYRIGITNVTLSRDHSPDGDAWDEDGTGPDPQICFTLASSDETVERCTDVERDTASPDFHTFALETVLEQEQMFEVQLCDDDDEGPDCWTIAQIYGLSVVTLRTASLTLIPDDPSRLEDWAVTLSFDPI